MDLTCFNQTGHPPDSLQNLLSRIPVHLIEISGTTERTGDQHGLPRKGYNPLPAPNPKMLRLARMWELELARHTPQYLDELYALRKGAGWQEDAMITLALTVPFDPHKIPEAACTAVAVLPQRTSDSRMLIGRNQDYFYDVSKESATIYHTEPDKGHTTLGCCSHHFGPMRRSFS